MDEIMKVRGLRKAYGSRVAVDGLDLELRPARSSASSATTARARARRSNASSGRRRRTRARSGSSAWIRSATGRPSSPESGVQFQESGYQDKIRVGELCEFTAALYRRSADWRELLARFGLGERKRSLACELSGGERQKLSIVLALLPEPELLFLDELTTGLDPAARREMWALIQGLRAGGATIFLTSHYMEEVEYLCDRVAIMKEGRIVARDTPAGLVAARSAKNLEEAFLGLMEEAC